MEHRLNKIHKRDLQLIHENSQDLTFKWSLIWKKSLVKDNSVIVDQINVQVLTTDLYKSKNGILPEIVDDIFYLVDKS